MYEINGITEFDFLESPFNNIQDYLLREGKKFVRFEGGYVNRYDLISYDMYGIVDMWWFVALANSVMDPFDDSIVGEQLVIPNIRDFFDVYLAEFET